MPGPWSRYWPGGVESSGAVVPPRVRRRPPLLPDPGESARVAVEQLQAVPHAVTLPGWTPAGKDGAFIVRRGHPKIHLRRRAPLPAPRTSLSDSPNDTVRRVMHVPSSGAFGTPPLSGPAGELDSRETVPRRTAGARADIGAPGRAPASGPFLRGPTRSTSHTHLAGRQ